ncbi:tetratricopeptide repeat protein [Catenulispora yoronensis]|uniref:tetratricopeptide repeat protein n=1 Tax=Catenulispora yoronensis TaxID=450799 RepID=UPI0031D59553
MRTNWSPLPENLDLETRRLIEKLRTLKDDSRLTLAELGTKTHYSSSSWERWLNGKRPITRAALLSIAELTHADLDHLLDLFERTEPIEEATQEETLPEIPAQRSTGPAQLPRDLPDYVGRERELETLVAGLLEPNRTVLPVWGVVGMGGLGKTSLAVRAAHRVSPFHPGGTLFLDLRGGSPEPLPVDAALLRLLRSAGVAETAIPLDTDDRAALLRSTLAGRRMLVVLDNALDAAQVRSLLPGDPGCGVIITSRNQLAGLEGVQRIFLGALSPADSRSLLTGIAGNERFDAEPEDGEAIVAICAGLPLALRIAGSRLAVRPHWAVQTLSHRLRSTASSLDELSVDDLAVRTCFESSYNTLIIDDVELGEVRALRLLGLWEGPEISLPAAAALLDLELTAAERELERLTDISLVQSPAPHRYRFHDLLHSFVSERAKLDLTPADQRAAIARLASWYAHTAAAASDLLFDGRRNYTLDGIDRPALATTFTNPDEALKWYDTESPTLVAITRQAHRLELDDLAATLPQIFQIYLELRFKIPEWLTTATDGLLSARRRKSTLDEAHLHTALSTAYSHAGHHTDAMTHARDSLASYEQAGDPINQARAMQRLAMAYELANDTDQARTWLLRAVDIFEATNYPYGAANCLNRLGMICNELGLINEAVTYLERCLTLIEPLGSPAAQASTLSNLGHAYLKQGNQANALTALTTADHLFTELEYEPGRATNLAILGEYHRATGHPDKAYAHYLEALTLLEDVGHPNAAEVREMLTNLMTSGYTAGVL